VTETTTMKKRKVGILVMLTDKEIQFLDRKVKAEKSGSLVGSRSSMIRYLINHFMIHPEIIDGALK